jgi:hypothetical protein
MTGSGTGPMRGSRARRWSSRLLQSPIQKKFATHGSRIRQLLSTTVRACLQALSARTFGLAKRKDTDRTDLRVDIHIGKLGVAAFQFWRETSPNYRTKRCAYLPTLPNSPDTVRRSRARKFATVPFPCGLHRPTSEIMQGRFRVLLHKAGKSESWGSGNSRQSLYSDCTADLEIVAFSAMLAI